MRTVEEALYAWLQIWMLSMQVDVRMAFQVWMGCALSDLPNSEKGDILRSMGPTWYNTIALP